MSNHLPECELSAECYLPHTDNYCTECEQSCICPALRACEQRVLTAFVARIQDRMTDSDLDNIVSDDGKDLIWAAIDALREEKP